MANDNKILFADTVADIKDLPLYDGAVVKTLGFSIIGDGGSATYQIHKKNNSPNIIKLSNSIWHSSDNKGTIVTKENGDIILNGELGETIIAECFIDNKILGANKSYAFSGYIVSGTYNTSKFSIMLEDYKNRKATQLGTGKPNSLEKFTTTEDGELWGLRFGFWGKIIFDNLIVHIQLEENTEKTEWKDGDYAINNHTILDINDEYIAVLSVTGNEISMPQMGYLPNMIKQDCHDSIEQYKSICRKENNAKYVLFFPAGRWLFSETDIHSNRKGVILRGCISQMGGSAGNQFRQGESVIMPFNTHQQYIWNIGKGYDSTEMVGGNEVKNLVFSTGYGLELGERRFCETALLLTYCCYSEFDGLYFSHVNGTGMALQIGWENKFGFLNFRGVGCATPDKTYSAVEFKTHPKKPNGFPSAISANYFDYFNFEGITGNCILFEQNCCAVHNEVNDIQAEWTYYDAYFPGVTTTFNTDTKEWDDPSADINHIYLIKGTVGGQYNPLIVNNISISTGGVVTRTVIWEGEDGLRHRRYDRISGIIGELEKYPVSNKRKDGKWNGRRDGTSIMINNVSSLSTNLPLFHSVEGIAPCTTIRLSQHHIRSMPLQGNNFPLECIKTNDWGNVIKNDEGYQTYFLSDVANTALEGVYNPDSISGKQFAYCHGAGMIKVDGTKTIKLRLYVDYTLDNFPGNHISVGVSASVDKGSYIDLTTWIMKDDFISGKYPLKQWFEYEIPLGLLPLCDFTLKYGLNRNVRVYCDCIYVGGAQKPILYSNLYRKGSMLTTIGKTIFCRDRKYNADSTTNGVTLSFNGTDWVTVDGRSAKTLPKATMKITYKLMNCESSNTSTEVTAETTFDTIITPTTDYTIDAITCTIDGYKYPITDKNINIPKVCGDVIITASATVHKIITNNLTNCVNSNELDSVTENKSYNTTITAESGYTLDSVTCTMGGVEQTVTNGKININKVTGDIVITANAVENECKAVSVTLDHCTIDYDKDYALKGSKVIMTITADDGYVLEPVIAKNGRDTIEVVDGIVTIWKVKGDIEITAEASLIPPTA